MTAARFASISLAVFAASLSALLVVSGMTGPSFAEVERVSATRRSEALVVALAKEGPGALLGQEASRTYRETVDDGVFPALIGGWASLIGRTSGVADGLTAARVGWLGVASLVPMAVFWMVEAQYGVALALLAAGLLFGMPSFVHAAGAASSEAVVTGTWFLVAATYVRSLRGKRAPCWAAACATTLGFGLSFDLATLWVAFPVLVHFMWIHGRELRRSWRRGRIPAPSAVLISLVVVPLVLGALSPHAWRAKPSALVEWLLGRVGTRAAMMLHHGAEVRDAPLYAIERLIAAIPLLVAVLAAVGAVALVRSRRRGPAAEHGGLGVPKLLLLLLAFVVVVLPVLPALIAPRPPRTIVALPVVAVLAAIGLSRTARQSVQARWPVLAALVVLLLAVNGSRQLPTAGAYFSALAGGTSRVVPGRIFEPGDGSEVAPLARAIDDAGRRRASVFAPDVPAGYFEILHALGRSRTELSASKAASRADFTIVRGARPGSLAEVARDRTVLWSLARRGD